MNHKRKTPKDSQEEVELAVSKRSLELEYEKRRKMEGYYYEKNEGNGKQSNATSKKYGTCQTSLPIARSSTTC